MRRVLARYFAADALAFMSSSSLAYAAHGRHFRVGNIAFMQGDIQSLDAAQAFYSRFLVIECAGVLHHMADPFRGWLSLLNCLAPGGLMLLGLYSAASRRNLGVLRMGSAYPGPDCDDDALRAFRQTLLEQPNHALGGELEVSRAGFLSAHGLQFRGFHLAPGSVCLKSAFRARPGRAVSRNGRI
jgi:SAM-dependent methyltransferase